MPTICDYAGVKAPDKCKGVSLRSIADGRKPRTRRQYVACSTHFVQDLTEDGKPIDLQGRMIRTKDFKYYIFDQGEQPEMLIDMKNDPGEMENLVGNPRYARVLAAHREMFAKYKKQTGDDFVERG
jgi:choline-sulfatase